MLAFLYSCDYDDESNPNPYEFDARMYALADKYGIEDLKDYAKYLFSRCLPPFGYEVKSYNAPYFVKALRVIYTTTLSSDRGLRNVVIPAIKKNIIDLRGEPDFVEMLSSGLSDGEFTMDVFDALLELGQPKTYQCLKCDQVTFPERILEEVNCWQCRKPAALIVGSELEP